MIIINMKIGFNTKTYVLIVAAIGSFLTAFLSNAISIAIPYIARDLAMSNIIQNWIATIFLLTVAVFSVPLGSLSGRYGLKRSFVLGIIIFLIGTILCAISFDSFSILASRVIQGIGGALLNVIGMALIVSEFEPQERGKGIGLNIAGVYIGLSLAPVIGGSLAFNFGWRSVFYIIIPFILLILLVSILKIPEYPVSENQKPFDLKGSIVYSLGIMLFIYGFTILNETLGMVLTGIGLLLLVVFTYIELHVEEPVFDVKLFKNSKFASANIAALISYIATFVTTLLINYHLQYIRGWNAQSAGFLIVILPVMMALLAPVAGRLSDKIKPQILAASGTAFVAIALFLLTFLNSDTPIYIIGLSLLLQGIGYGLFSSPNTNVVMGSVPPKYIPAASSAVATVRSVGQTMSMGMLTVIFAIFMGTVKIVPVYYPLLIYSSQIAFSITTVLAVVAFFASLVGLKSKDMYNNGK